MKRPIALIAASAVLLLFAGCSTPPPAAPPPDLSNAAVVSSLTTPWRDQYTKGSGFIGPELSPVRYKNLYLRALKLDGGPFAYQVYVRDQYRGDWRFYDSAYDIDGNRLGFASIDRKTDDCRYGCDLYESMSVTVPREYLEQRRNRGLNFKVLGKSGERTVEVPAGYVAGFLDSVKETVVASGGQTERAPAKRLDPSRLNDLRPGISTIADAKMALGPVKSESSMATGSTVLQWIEIGAHIVILFDSSGTMVRVTHKYVQ